MLISMRRALLWSVVGALLATALFALFLALLADAGLLPDGRGWAELPAVALLTWTELLAVAFLVLTVAFATARAASSRCRRALTSLASRLAAVRKNPWAHSLSGAPLSAELAPMLGPLYGQVELLCASYRHALADLITQREALDSLRGLLGRVDADKGLGLTVIERGAGSSRNMVARLTPTLHWTSATPALQQFLGWRLADLNGRAFAELVHPEDLPGLRRAFQDALESGEAHNVTFRVRCRPFAPAPRDDGDADGPAAQEVERHVQADVLTRYTEEGRPLHFRCFLLDITDKVRAERELRRRTEELSASNNRLLRINQELEQLKESYLDRFNNAPVMYFMLDADGLFLACNDTMCRTLGYPRKDLQGHPYARVLPPERQTRYLQDAEAYQRQGEMETKWAKKDGTVIHVWIRSVPVLDGEGRFLRSRSVAQDVTQRNRMANELRRRTHELERANGDLRQINKELDEFTSVVSHDLKEPLRTIEGYSTALAEDYSTRLGPDGFQCVNHLLGASRRLGRLIDDLLTLCRAGRMTKTLSPFPLAEAVATVRKDLADLIQRKEATLRVEGALPVVVVDPERITQLLANLVANGLKYNTSPGPRVVIGALPEGHAWTAPGQVTIYVRDNGIGIDPRFHQEIFGIFRRLHQRDEYEGTGAGLAICKKIVEAHGGRIWVESQPGQGATFFFTLPRPRPGAAERATAPVALRPAPAPGARPKPAQVDDTAAQGQANLSAGARLLLVEDTPAIAHLVQRFARRNGHAVKWVTTAEQAWDYLQRERPDLVLLDIHLPGMDGVELCRRLRAAAQYADLRVALFSQAANPEDIGAGLAAGANFVFSKELLAQPDVWRRRIEEMLSYDPQQVANQV